MQGGQGQACVIQEVTNCVIIKNQSQYSLTDLEPPCEVSSDVGLNLLGRPLQTYGFFPMSFPIIEQTSELSPEDVDRLKKPLDCELAAIYCIPISKRFVSEKISSGVDAGCRRSHKSTSLGNSLREIS